jgi:hypothetical protein
VALAQASEVERRRYEPLADAPRAHRGRAAIDHPPERAGAASAAGPFENPEVAACPFIETELLAQVVELRGAQMTRPRTVSAR